jgi:hypothetical protein
MYCSLRCKRVVIAGASSDARLACAEERVEEGVSSKCYGRVISLARSVLEMRQIGGRGGFMMGETYPCRR